MMGFLAKVWRVLSLPKNIQLSIMHLSQDQFLVGVTGIIFNDKDEILMFKHTYRQTPWSLPGGYIKAKEHPKEGLEREIEEESGLIVSAQEQLKLRTDRQSARLDICLIGTYIGGEFKASSEVSEAAFYSFEDLPQISKNHLILIDQALKQKKSLQSEFDDKPSNLFKKIRQWL